MYSYSMGYMSGFLHEPSTTSPTNYVCASNKGYDKTTPSPVTYVVRIVPKPHVLAHN